MNAWRRRWCRRCWGSRRHRRHGWGRGRRGSRGGLGPQQRRRRWCRRCWGSRRHRRHGWGRGRRGSRGGLGPLMVMSQQPPSMYTDVRWSWLRPGWCQPALPRTAFVHDGDVAATAFDVHRRTLELVAPRMVPARFTQDRLSSAGATNSGNARNRIPGHFLIVPSPDRNCRARSGFGPRLEPQTQATPATASLATS